MFFKQKIQRGESIFIIIFFTVKVQNLSKIKFLVEENINFCELYVRHFPREFANSMVNPASVTGFGFGLVWLWFALGF